MAQKPFLIRGSLAILLAAGIWFPSVHWFFSGSGGKSFSKTSIPQKARELAARQLQMWTDPKQRTHELERMRRSNAEWDFMGRGFLVWSLAEMGLREPALKAAYLPIIDRIIDETVRLETEQGIHFFLMPYSKARPYVVQPPRSHFLDGEIALMLAMRRTLEEKAEYRAPLTERVNLMIERMSKSKVLAAESYPDECWMFDHAVALAAIKLADHLDGSDHAAFFRQWVATARKELIHPDTGLLISSFTTEGRSLDGPEGSSIWMVAHCLRLIDEDFAGDQYRRARKELGREFVGFAYSRQWPVSWEGSMDIDSGAVIPVLGASPGGSGLAFIGASSFGDVNFSTKLHASLDFAALPSRRNGGLKYCASNQVGDAVVLYASVLGPAWQKVKKGEKK